MGFIKAPGCMRPGACFFTGTFNSKINYILKSNRPAQKTTLLMWWEQTIGLPFPRPWKIRSGRINVSSKSLKSSHLLSQAFSKVYAGDLPLFSHSLILRLFCHLLSRFLRFFGDLAANIHFSPGKFIHNIRHHI